MINVARDGLWRFALLSFFDFLKFIVNAVYVVLIYDLIVCECLR